VYLATASANSGIGRVDQPAMAGRPMMGSSWIGAMVSRVSPAFISNRDGVTFTRRISWAFDGGGSVAVEARAATLDACDERIAGHVLRLWPELDEAAQWL
jgi:hypothetical protein